MTSSFYNFFLFLFWDVRTDVLCLEMDGIADKSFGAKTGQYTGARFMFGNGRNYRKALWHTNRAMCRRTNCD